MNHVCTFIYIYIHIYIYIYIFSNISVPPEGLSLDALTLIVRLSLSPVPLCGFLLTGCVDWAWYPHHTPAVCVILKFTPVKKQCFRAWDAQSVSARHTILLKLHFVREWDPFTASSLLPLCLFPSFSNSSDIAPLVRTPTAPLVLLLPPSTS